MPPFIDKHGQVTFGVFEHGPADINYLDFDLRNNMDKPITGWRKRMRFNQFQFISLTGEDFVLGVAIVNLKWVSNCFVYIYQPSTQTFKEFSWLQPFARNTLTNTTPNNGSWQFKTRKNKIVMTAETGKRKLHIQLKNELTMDVTIN